MRRIVCLLLTLTMMFSILSINASAARAEEFLSEVALVYEDSVEEAREAIAGTDWKLLEYDLNANSDYMFDNGVYLIYKTSTNVEDAITDLRVMDMYGGYSTSNYEKQLEASRAQYIEMTKELRKAMAEFKVLYEAGDAMAVLAYRQMNYYKDTKTVGGTETDMLMGDFFLSMPEDAKIVQVMLEGNSIIVSNLLSLLTIGLSGTGEGTFASKVAVFYAIKDTLTAEKYHEDATVVGEWLKSVSAKINRYDALVEKYSLDDGDMTEEEYQFIKEIGAVAVLTEGIKLGDTSLADLLRTGNWTLTDIYPIVAALSDGQMALAKMGAFEIVLKHSTPSSSIEDLYDLIEEVEAQMIEKDGSIKPIDVYMGVDRSIFKGSFAMTNAAERQQALTGETWNMGSAVADSTNFYIAAGALALLDIVAWGGFAISNSASTGIEFYKIGEMISMTWQPGVGFKEVTPFWQWNATGVWFYTAIGLALIAAGLSGISTWYNYYNPDYTEIPNTMIDVRETDLGDKYVKYTAAKVFEDGKISEKNADFNAYEGKEWIALYYTKDATAGNCLTSNFVFNDNDSTIARRHQGISMFGETTAFNLNSHVYSSNAKGAYLTVRYSTTKKAAADLPEVVGTMSGSGALYAVTALAGVGLGVGGTLFVQSYRKKKEDELESGELPESSDPIEPEIPEKDLEAVEPAEIEENEEILESEETFENTETAEASEMIENSENIKPQEDSEKAESTEESTENTEEPSKTEDSVEE